MRVLSWNVQGAVPPFGHKERIRNQIEFLQSEADLPDILLLNEVTTAQREFWRDSLRDIGYSEMVDTLDWAAELGESDVPPHQDINHVNGNLTGIHERFEGDDLTRLPPSIRDETWGDSDLKAWDTNFPEKILHAAVEVEDSTIDLWNVRTVPGSMYGEEKIKIMENTYARITKAGRFPCILAGDFNAPKDELEDGTIVPWRSDEEGALAERWAGAEFGLLSGLNEYGMVDIFRNQHGYGDLDVLDVSFQSKRFDHVIASNELNPTACYYAHEGFDRSDHAPVVAQFDI